MSFCWIYWHDILNKINISWFEYQMHNCIFTFYNLIRISKKFCLLSWLDEMKFFLTNSMSPVLHTKFNKPLLQITKHKSNLCQHIEYISTKNWKISFKIFVFNICSFIFTESIQCNQKFHLHWKIIWKSVEYLIKKKSLFNNRAQATWLVFMIEFYQEQSYSK